MGSFWGRSEDKAAHPRLEGESASEENSCGEMQLTRSCVPEAASQIRMVLSPEPDASVQPSGDHATLATVLEWPSSVFDEKGEGRGSQAETRFRSEYRQ